MSNAVVFIGGDPPDPGVVSRLPAGATVIAADSGLDHALGLGVKVDRLVGDLDSVSPEGLRLAEETGIVIERHRPDKDATDTELALDAAAAAGARHITVVSGGGDRLDHSLGALEGLARPALRPVVVEAYWGEAHVHVLHERHEVGLRGRPGDVVSLVPVHGPAEGIVTEGLRYPLHDERLEPGSSRGLSNELVADEATVRLRHGSLLVITPFALREDR